MSHGSGEVVANEPIGLAEAITAVRGELARAQVAATGLKRFEVGDITMEFTVALSRDDSADVGIAPGSCHLAPIGRSPEPTHTS